MEESSTSPVLLGIIEYLLGTNAKIDQQLWDELREERLQADVVEWQTRNS